jgi:hypothetical protein
MKHTDHPQTSLGAEEAESEFDFSRSLVTRVAPYADVQHAQSRTWRRLSQSSKTQPGRVTRAGMWWQPSAMLAACALTFVLGVWFGKREQSLITAQPKVSAEPLAFGHRAELDLVGRARSQNGHENGADNKMLQAAGSAQIGGGDNIGADRISADDIHADNGSKLVSGNGRGRAHGALAGAVSRSPVVLDVEPNTVGVPTSNVNESIVLPATLGGKNNAVRSVWHNLANKGEYEAALVEIAQAGGYERVLATANPEQLMLLSDVARATGQQQRALAALGRIVNEHSNDPVAPLAALNMGNLLDKMGDGVGATQAFARYRALSPQGEFAEDALIRQLRSAVKAGQQALARKLVRQYEADFPDGRSAGEVAQLAEQLPNTAVEADAGTSSE